VEEFLAVGRQLCEVLTKVRGERWWEKSEQELRAYRGAIVKKEKNEQPHTLLVLYPLPANKDAFESAYLGEQLPLVRKLPAKAIRTEVVLGTLAGGIAPYHRITELHFEDQQSLRTCTQSTQAQSVLQNAVQISTGGKPHFLVLESELGIDEEPRKPRPPFKCTLYFSTPQDKNSFDTAYFTEIFPAILKLPAKQFKAYSVVATADDEESPFNRTVEFFFESRVDLETCLGSTYGKQLLNAVKNAPSVSFLVFTAEG